MATNRLEILLSMVEKNPQDSFARYGLAMEYANTGDLERAIARLPEEQRSLILLVGLEGMRYDEVASVVNLPIGTVRSRISRGREALRSMTGLFPSRHSRRPRIGADLAAPRRRAANGNHFQSRLPEISQ